MVLLLYDKQERLLKSYFLSQATININIISPVELMP